MTSNRVKTVNEKGYSLVEMLVVVAIFCIILIITTNAFDKLISTASHQTRSASGNIEGIVGLEMLRRDLSHAGYGLPWSYQVTPASAFSEVTTAPATTLGLAPSSFNEITPHAISVGTTAGTTNPGTDYLVIKSAVLPLPQMNTSVGRWGYLNYSTSGGVGKSYIKRIGDAASDVRNSGTDRVITLASGISSSGAETRMLLNTASKYFYAVSDSNFIADPDLQPVDPSLSYIVYAIADRDLAMPYNRADYYVTRDPNFKMPPTCNPGTGTLFKAVADHSGGYSTPYPLLNCVADMKVVYFLNVNGDGTVTPYPATSPVVTALTPEQLRIQLKSVNVYVLAQDGRKDPSYTYPGNSLFLGPVEGRTPAGAPINSSSGRTWTKSQLDSQFPDWQHYRWKVYEIPVNPKNMQN